MFARRGPVSEVAELERIEDAVRDRYGLGEDALVLVTEEPAGQPGLDSGTTILFWTAGGTRHRIWLFKPAAGICSADLPPAWLRGALVDQGEVDCC